MKLKIATLLIAVWCISGLYAQKQWVGFMHGQAGVPQITMVQQDESKLVIDIAIQGMYVSEVQQDGIKYRKLELFPFQTTQEIGKPELPIIAKTIGIPNNQLVDVKIENTESVLLKDYMVYPFQTPTTDNKGAKKHPFTIDQAFYSSSNTYPQTEALVDNIGICRDIKVGGLKIIPFDYNASTKELTVFTKIRVTVTFSGYDSKINVHRGKKVSPNFYKMYQNAVYNFSSLGLSTDTKTDPEPLYLIITNTEALTTIQPLIDWKNRQGYRVEVKTLGTGFNTPQHFKDYITNLYNNNTTPLEYILMVGDAYPNGGTGGGNNIVPMYH